MSEEPDTCDTLVIGAGVVGLALARAFAMRGDFVVVVEAEPAIGVHTSSRNSEVIHAGIYYPPGSLKAALCVRGKQQLYAYCRDNGVEARAVGKLIVACDESEAPGVARLVQQAAKNGVHDLSALSAAEIKRLEPAVQASSGVLSPSTGIIDSHGLMTAFKRDASEAGAALLFSTRVISGWPYEGGILVQCEGRHAGPIACARVINAAGLWAPDVARTIATSEPVVWPTAHYARGHYFTLSGPSPFSHLVYPAPVAHGLGVHVTLDLQGRARFGPDVQWVDGVDYGFDESRLPRFAQAIRRYYPALDAGRLEPGYTGIRPKLGDASTPARDFVIEGPAQHGQSGLLHLFGIESPGLTASLALAEHVLGLLT